MRQLAAKEIGERIAQARKEAGGMTQEQLADLLNVSTRSVQDYERGVTIPWKYFQTLEEIFTGKTLGWFLHGEAGNGDDSTLEAPTAAELLAAVSDLRDATSELAAAVAGLREQRSERALRQEQHEHP